MEFWFFSWWQLKLPTLTAAIPAIFIENQAQIYYVLSFSRALIWYIWQLCKCIGSYFMESLIKYLSRLVFEKQFYIMTAETFIVCNRHTGHTGNFYGKPRPYLLPSSSRALIWCILVLSLVMKRENFCGCVFQILDTY